MKKMPYTLLRQGPFQPPMVELRSVGAVWRGTNICHSFDGEALQQLHKLLQGVCWE
jgi:hypothetical protein